MIIIKFYATVWTIIWVCAMIFALIRGFAFVFMVMSEAGPFVGLLVFVVHMFFVLPAIATMILFFKS